MPFGKSHISTSEIRRLEIQLNCFLSSIMASVTVQQDLSIVKVFQLKLEFLERNAKLFTLITVEFGAILLPLEQKSLAR